MLVLYYPLASQINFSHIWFSSFPQSLSLYTPPMPKFFTLQQANETLEIIRPLMDEIQAIRQRILDKQPETWNAIEKSVGNGGNRTLSSHGPGF